MLLDERCGKREYFDQVIGSGENPLMNIFYITVPDGRREKLKTSFGIISNKELEKEFNREVMERGITHVPSKFAKMISLKRGRLGHRESYLDTKELSTPCGVLERQL